MTAQTIQAFDGRRPVIVNPSEIKEGDWMRDLGRLRQVESAEASANRLGAVLVRFADGEDGRYATLSVPEAVAVTVWRALPEAAGAGRV